MLPSHLPGFVTCAGNRPESAWLSRLQHKLSSNDVVRGLLARCSASTDLTGRDVLPHSKESWRINHSYLPIVNILTSMPLLVQAMSPQDCVPNSCTQS